MKSNYYLSAQSALWENKKLGAPTAEYEMDNLLVGDRKVLNVTHSLKRYAAGLTITHIQV